MHSNAVIAKKCRSMKSCKQCLLELIVASSPLLRKTSIVKLDLWLLDSSKHHHFPDHIISLPPVECS